MDAIRTELLLLVQVLTLRMIALRIVSWLRQRLVIRILRVCSHGHTKVIRREEGGKGPGDFLN